MTETAKHTPGPWIVDEDDPHCVYAPDGDNDPWFVAEAAYDCGPGNSGIANAAHIVKCVNEYPGLLARAERLASAVQHLSEVSDDALVYGISDDDARLLRDAWAEINAALAALKAGA